jgi:uncharacterized protein (DUF1778 family)
MSTQENDMVQTKPTTLSARFDEREMELLKRAAEKRQWSLSQLIRCGAFEKAANIVNATGPIAGTARDLVREVVSHLLRPRVEDESNQPVGALLADTGWHVVPVSERQYQDLIVCIRTLGSELAAWFEEEAVRLKLPPALSSLIDPMSSNPRPIGSGNEPRRELGTVSSEVQRASKRKQPPGRRAEEKSQ